MDVLTGLIPDNDKNVGGNGLGKVVKDSLGPMLAQMRAGLHHAQGGLQAVPALIAEMKELRDEVDELKESVAELEKQGGVVSQGGLNKPGLMALVTGNPDFATYVRGLIAPGGFPFVPPSTPAPNANAVAGPSTQSSPGKVDRRGRDKAMEVSNHLSNYHLSCPITTTYLLYFYSSF